MKDEDLKNLIASNAKAIQALTNGVVELQKDRKGIYELLGRMARSQSDFYATQADFYERFDRLEERQARMTEILDRLDPHDRQ
jgi:flagellar capping protein FliD